LADDLNKAQLKALVDLMQEVLKKDG